MVHTVEAEPARLGPREATPTPGPWVAEAGEDDGSWSVYSAEEFVITKRGPWRHNAAQSNANARLIAAAPTLLDALEHIAQWSEHFAFAAAASPVDEDTIVALGHAFSAHAEMAREAIAKAVGSAVVRPLEGRGKAVPSNGMNPK